MSLSRRRFVLGAAAAPVLARTSFRAGEPTRSTDQAQLTDTAAIPPDTFEPWIEVQGAALRENVGVLARLAASRPIIAVVKNNGYGLGLREVCRIFEPDERIQAFGVVKVSEALALREAGIRKPILLLALFDDADGEELVRRDVTLSLCVPDAAARVARAARRANRRARAQLYIDTGMSRMGLPYHAAAGLVVEAAREPRLALSGMLTELTEDREFDREQVNRLWALAREVRGMGVDLGGPLHAASSHAVFNHAETLLDAVRPGISLFGAYPTDDGSERAIATLRVGFALKARVVRVERMRAGDTVGYGRHFRADAPTWIATLPVGHADGYPRRAVNGGNVLIGGRTYPVIGAVSASHTIVNLGLMTTVRVGDVATLLGPDHAEIHPNALAAAAGISVYDVLMHLSPSIRRLT
jgi:alanine racemase